MAQSGDRRIDNLLRAADAAKNIKFKVLWGNKAMALMKGQREPESRVVQQSEYN